MLRKKKGKNNVWTEAPSFTFMGSICASRRDKNQTERNLGAVGERKSQDYSFEINLSCYTLLREATQPENYN